MPQYFEDSEVLNFGQSFTAITHTLNSLDDTQQSTPLNKKEE